MSLVKNIKIIIFFLFFILGVSQWMNRGLDHSIGLFFFTLALLIFFVVSCVFCNKLSDSAVIVYIFLYNSFLTLLLVSYYFIEYTPFGFAPIDAVYYDNLANVIKNMGFSEAINYMNYNKISPSDYGFSLLQWLVYKLPGQGVINMKVVNVLLHTFTSLYIYKTAKYIMNAVSAKNLLILFGLFPLSVFYLSSGLKEPLFVFFVTLSFYFLYKYINKKELVSLVLSIMFCASILFFRTPVAMMMFVAISYYLYINIGGRYKILFKPFAILLCLVFIGVAIYALLDDFQYYFARDVYAVMEARSGGQFGIKNLILNTISGFIGPFPTFLQLGSKDNEMLQSAGVFIKLTFSFYFVVGTYKILNCKLKPYYPIVLFLFMNIPALILYAATLDSRFQYPFLPLYFIVTIFGYEFSIRKKYRLLNEIYLVMISLFVIVWQMRTSM